MSLVNAKCTNCGSTLQVDESKDAMTCPHCNSAFIVEKAIKNFTINAGTVNVFVPSNDFVIEAGVLLQYKGAATKVEIPDGVFEIAGDAFEGLIKYMQEITLPASIRCIKARVNSYDDIHSPFFDRGEDEDYTLKTLKYKGTIEDWCSIDFDDFGATLSCPLAENLYIDGKQVINLKIPPMAKISASAFNGVGTIQSLELSEGITEIGAHAFTGCAIREVDLPDSVMVCRNAFNYGTKIRMSRALLTRNRQNKKLCVNCGAKMPLFGNQCKTCRVTYEFKD